MDRFIKNIILRERPLSNIQYAYRWGVRPTVTAFHHLVAEVTAGGCSRSGVLASLMWCLVVHQLLDTLRTEGFLVYSWGDDVALIASGKFIGVLKKTMSYALHVLDEWCAETKWSINPDKTFATTKLGRRTCTYWVTVRPSRHWNNSVGGSIRRCRSSQQTQSHRNLKTSRTVRSGGVM